MAQSGAWVPARNCQLGLVDRLAGLPNTVIDRAKTILERLEADNYSHNLQRKRMRKEISGQNTRDEDDQLALF
jgi:DNA mismatch repair ATPase MutS